jgi:hypothetical protein
MTPQKALPLRPGRWYLSTHNGQRLQAKLLYPSVLAIRADALFPQGRSVSLTFLTKGVFKQCIGNCIAVREGIDLLSRYRDTERQWTGCASLGPRPNLVPWVVPAIGVWIQRRSLSDSGLITHLAEDTEC